MKKSKGGGDSGKLVKTTRTNSQAKANKAAASARRSQEKGGGKSGY